MPFLTLFTRHMASRPRMYSELLASIEAQTDRDFEHVVTVDETGQGFAWANRQMAAQRHRVTGDYVLQCDDDLILAPDAVAQIKAAALATNPDIIVYRVDHCQLGILPDDVVWRKQFRYSHIGGEDMAIRRDVWAEHLYAYDSAAYEADWCFMSTLAMGDCSIHWLDKLLIRCQRISHGQGE
jgi:glycosyltransferase involved in cell wall biosynthesis